MCGRYFIDTDFMEILKKYQVEKSTIEHEQSPGEVFPGTKCLIIRHGTQRRADMLHWGMPYSFTKSPIINVRTESIDKPIFASSFRYRRCIIPCNFFYEWKSLPGRNKKNKVEISLHETRILSLGGIFHKFKDDNGKEFEAFAILTTPATNELRDIHHRMPLILNGREDDFLRSLNDKELKKLITMSQNWYKFSKNIPCHEQNFIV
ncbi:MAG: SOS response-associated peptidase [Tissierellia bacterium]|nr:SOS response-associated peptidase [Tissierellia bacterium]